ncbi:hypothetical protein CYMTET_56022 [Cymbomonas tetramitiformis]|uniref:ShKT domain-containing protein n=1 Tax=Cymbomonas tetramitiformis TaxID=36881 RepID=A0AAE0BBR9_9CHLO|nr:hypothetical protein CYMTET_56022 [Cymbomonas tetramitiformis]
MLSVSRPNQSVPAHPPQRGGHLQRGLHHQVDAGSATPLSTNAHEPTDAINPSKHESGGLPVPVPPLPSPCTPSPPWAPPPSLPPQTPLPSSIPHQSSFPIPLQPSSSPPLSLPPESRPFLPPTPSPTLLSSLPLLPPLSLPEMHSGNVVEQGPRRHLSSCTDSDANCPTWATWVPTECYMNSNYMLNSCKYSCGVCGNHMLNYGGSGCTSEYPCKACAGDCDTDADCVAGAACLQRGSNEAVPGCASGGDGDYSGYDYCYDRTCHFTQKRHLCDACSHRP